MANKFREVLDLDPNSIQQKNRIRINGFSSKSGPDSIEIPGTSTLVFPKPFTRELGIKVFNFQFRVSKLHFTHFIPRMVS